MRPTVGRVSSLTTRTERRLARLQTLAVGIRPPVTAQKRRVLSYLTIEAANLWDQYSVALFMSCALGARDSAGNRIAPNPATDETYALDMAVHAMNPALRGIRRPWDRTERPDLKSKGVLARCLDYIDASIYPEVEAAISFKTRVLADLPTMRNFFAHKAERAARAARALGPHYGITQPLKPDELLVTHPPGSGDTLINEWFADFAAILDLMP